MAATKTPDEIPKQKLAKRLITPKRRYFFPDHSLSVEASSLDEAQDIVSKKLKQKKVGDAQ